VAVLSPKRSCKVDKVQLMRTRHIAGTLLQPVLLTRFCTSFMLLERCKTNGMAETQWNFLEK
jgi:hypothetical protein